MAYSVRWYGHVLRREDGHFWIRALDFEVEGNFWIRALDFEVEGQRMKGRPKRA